MLRRRAHCLIPFLLLLLAVPARADDVSDLVTRLEAAGARVLTVSASDARLNSGRVTTGLGPDGIVEVYLPEAGPRSIRTPLRGPSSRMSVDDFRAMANDMRSAVRELYGVEVERVYIAGSSSGIPFRDSTGELRTFDRKGVGSSDYDGAIVSEELFEIVEREAPRTVRGRNTGLRTAPDPLPELRERFHAISERYGRHVAAMVYASDAEFQKRMQLLEFTVGVNVMGEPSAEAKAVAPTRAEMLGALVEARTTLALVAAHGVGEARTLLEAAERGEARAARTVWDVRAQVVSSTGAELASSLNETDRATLKHEGARLADPAAFANRSVRARAPPVGARASEGTDSLQRYRRADGTLEWARLKGERVLHHGAGAAHFALSLFLKELAVVVKTGDRARIDEFFEGLMTTDFFVTYGLFSVGAHAGNVAYSRYLSRFVKPRFVSGILRTNVVLATGLALPEIVHGEFSGRSFAINLTSLGLSATAVKAGLSGIKWVVDLERARRTGTLARTGAKLGRLARMGGWFFTAVETAVVLYFGDEIAKAINSHLSDREARNAVADATANALAASAQGTDDAFERALDALGNAHVDYRNHLLQPLGAVEALYHSRLVRAATKAKLLADQRSAARERLLRYPALRRDVVERFGSTAGYLEAMQRQAEADVDADLSEAMTAYERAREKVLSAAYHAPRRESPYLPEGTGSTFWRGLGLRPAARTLSANRVQAYEDELAALEALAMAAARHPTRVAAVEEAIARTREIQRRDEALARDAAEGMNEAVSRIAAGGD